MKVKTNTMVKEDICKMISQNENISYNDAKHMLDTVLGTITECLIEGQNVKVVGFGTFTVKRCKEKKSTNPRTHEIIIIPAQNRLGLKYSTILMDKVKYNEELTEKLQKAAEADKYWGV